jgi:hypothetical protein
LFVGGFHEEGVVHEGGLHGVRGHEKHEEHKAGWQARSWGLVLWFAGGSIRDGW